MPQPALSGIVEQDDSLELKQEIRRLESELRAARLEIQKANNEAATAIAAVTALRHQLSPLHRALRAIFGEIDLIAQPEAVQSSAGASPVAADSRIAAVWTAWKEKLPGLPARFIDAMLTHGEMNAAQLSIAAPCHRANVSKIIYRLNKAGLINKNGDRFSLKQL
jgi:hypothetical protein